jgi:hypothetical protein
VFDKEVIQRREFKCLAGIAAASPAQRTGAGWALRGESNALMIAMLELTLG